MTRAALLPAGADPFLNAYWLRNYRTWADEVDELHVAVCGPIPTEVVEYIRNWVASVPHATVEFIPERTSHGTVIDLLLDRTTADHVLLIEDDAFVRSPGVIDENFRQIESGEAGIVGCPRRGYATENLLDIARALCGDEPRGMAFWPCFLFVSRDALEATDRRFGSTIFSAGEKVLGKKLTEPADADTLVWASLQLRAQGLKVSLREMHRVGDPIPTTAEWFHVGSLSSGHGYIWQGELTPREYADEIDLWHRLPAGEAAKRMAWWQRAWDHWDGGIPEYHAAYGDGFRQAMADFGIDQREVAALRGDYGYLVSWDESPFGKWTVPS